MKTSRIIFFLLTFILLSHFDSSAQWERMFIPESGYNLNDVVMLDTLTAITVGEFGTILITHDGFRSWKRCAIKTKTDFYCLGFFDKKIAITAGAEGAMMRSTDSGETWQKTQQSTINVTLRRIAVLSPTVAVAVGNRGTIIRTTNAGKSWNKIASGTVLDLHSVSFNTSGVGIAVGKKGVIVRSIDYGTSWQLQNSPTQWDLNAVSMVDNIVCAGGDSALIVRSVDSGSSWVLQAVLYTLSSDDRKNDLPDDILDIHFINSSTGFLCGFFTIVNRVHYHRIYRTDDSGQSWRRILLPNVSESDDKALNPTANGIWKKLAFQNGKGFAVGYTTNDRSVSAILSTSDAGVAWHIVLDRKIADSLYPQSKSEDNFTSVNFDGSDVILCQEQNALQRSIDGGFQWTKQDFVGSFHNYKMDYRGNIGVIGSDSGRIYVSTDKGKIWQMTLPFGRVLTESIYLATTMEGCSILNDSTLFCSGQVRGTNYLFRSTNAGKQWEQIHPNGNIGDTLTYSTQYSVPAFATSTIGFVVAQSYTVDGYFDKYALYRTEDQGKTWTDATPYNRWNKSDVLYFPKITFLDGQHGWYSVNNEVKNGAGKIYVPAILKTINGGVSWERIELKDSPALKDFDFNNHSFVVTSLDFSTPNDGIIVVFPSVGSIIILRTKNGGTTWEQMSTKGANISNINYLDVKYQDSTTAWIVGKNRTVLRWKKETITGVHEQPEPSDGITISPNPASTSVIIQLNTPSIQETAVLTIRTILGQVVYTTPMSEGNEPRSTIDVGELSNGVYIVHIAQAGRIISKSIIINH